VDSILIQNEALKLSPYERARLADSLLVSLDEDVDREIEKSWAEESEKRLNAYQRGDIRSLEGPAAMAQLRQELAQ